MTNETLANIKNSSIMSFEEVVKRQYAERKFHRSRQKTSCSTKKSENYRLYIIYSNMLGRCYNKRYSTYKQYGAKGIKVCDEWKNSFKMFKEWAYKNGYKEELSLDRVDGSKDYSPENCRFIPFEINRLNRTKSAYFILDGGVVSFSDLKKMYSLGKEAQLYKDAGCADEVCSMVKDIDSTAKISVYRFEDLLK